MWRIKVIHRYFKQESSKLILSIVNRKLNQITWPSRPTFTGLFSFHGFNMYAHFVKNKSFLKNDKKNIKHKLNSSLAHKQLLKQITYFVIQSILNTPFKDLALSVGGRIQFTCKSSSFRQSLESLAIPWNRPLSATENISSTLAHSLKKQNSFKTLEHL